MKLSRLLEKVNVLADTAGDMEIKGICYDSRLAEPGYVFVAIKGFETDGHKYIRKAAELGASAVVCETEPDCSIPYVKVDNSRLALALMSCAFYDDPAKEMYMIGFTGTSGKTSSTHILKYILENAAGAKVGLIGTNGNMIGATPIHTEHTTPESLELQALLRRMADEGCSHVVMEVSSHALALDRVAGIHYNTAVFTNLSQDHLDFHKDMKDYASAKRLLFSRCDTAVINADDEWADFMQEGISCPVISYSAKQNDASLVAKDIRMNEKGVRFAAVYGDSLSLMRLNIPGEFSVYNALSVTAAALSAGVGLQQCADSMKNAPGVKGRMENVPTGKDFSVIIDYSHKPDALEKALKSLRPVTRGRLICLFGCGGDRDKLKRPIMGEIAADNSDLVIVTSDNPRTEDPQTIINEILEGVKNRHTHYRSICDRTEAIDWAIDKARPGDVILLAGKGHEDYQVVGHEKHHMDEREIVADSLRKLG